MYVEVKEKVAAMETKRKACDNRGFKSMEEHAPCHLPCGPCAILPLPENLDESIGSPGLDGMDANIDVADKDCEEQIRNY